MRHALRDATGAQNHLKFIINTATCALDSGLNICACVNTCHVIGIPAAFCRQLNSNDESCETQKRHNLIEERDTAGAKLVAALCWK
jgi:hypothetical protein